MFAINITTQNNDYTYPETSTATTNYLPKVDAKTDNIFGKNITDRQTINVTATCNPSFKEYNKFNNIAEMLDYFLAEITRIHEEHAIPDVDFKIKNFVAYTKNIEFKSPRRVFNDAKDLYNFLRKVTLFIEVSLKTVYNKIINIVDYFFIDVGRINQFAKV